jgi:beta-N-acetylglucosaminidase
MPFAISLLKRFWWVSIVIGVLVYSQIRISNIEETLQTTVQNHKQQIEIIESANQQLKQENEMAILNYQTEMRSLDERYILKFKELQQQKNLEISSIERELKKKNFEAVAMRIKGQYGFNYVAPL